MANRYEVIISWRHKGSRYNNNARGTVKATGIPSATGKAYRAFCKGNPSVRMPKGATMWFEVTNLGKVISHEGGESLPDKADGS